MLSLSYLYEVMRTDFSSDFFEFSQFLTAISQKNVAPTSNESENCVVHLKEQSLLKKAENRVEIGQ